MNGFTAPRLQLLGIAVVLLVSVVAQVAIAGGGTGERPWAGKSANLTKQVKQLKARIAALEAKPGSPSGSPSGSAGGELAGAFPNPTVGTVAGLDLATATAADAGINFGSDTNLYRSTDNELRTDDFLMTNGLMSNRLTMGPELGPSVLTIGLPNRVFLFTRDNGAGKTRLMARWPTGPEVVLFTEP